MSHPPGHADRSPASTIIPTRADEQIGSRPDGHFHDKSLSREGTLAHRPPAIAAVVRRSFKLVDAGLNTKALQLRFEPEGSKPIWTTVFIFAKDRLENWIEFLITGNTDESKEGPRVKHNRAVANAAKKLADICKAGKSVDGMPPSLVWSCRNWRALAERMKS